MDFLQLMTARDCHTKLQTDENSQTLFLAWCMYLINKLLDTCCPQHPQTGSKLGRGLQDSLDLLSKPCTGLQIAVRETGQVKCCVLHDCQFSIHWRNVAWCFVTCMSRKRPFHHLDFVSFLLFWCSLSKTELELSKGIDANHSEAVSNCV